MTKKHHEEL